MPLKTVIDEALHKPMSRRDFLSHVGAVMLAVVGITTILHSLGLHAGNSPARQQPSDNVARGGYGSSAYGS